MAETLISPGVFLNENDLSQITQGPVAAGAAILGPTVIGPVNIPTLVTSYSQYKAIFGAAFVSGGANYEYLTSIAALNYFEQGGESLLVTRVASGSYTAATASVANNIPGGGVGSGTQAAMSMSLTDDMFNDWYKGIVFTLGEYDDIKIAASSWQGYDNYANTYFVNSYGGGTWPVDTFGAQVVLTINNTPAISSRLTASYNSSTNVLSVSASSVGTQYNNTLTYGGQYIYWDLASFPSSSTFVGGTNAAGATTTAFVLETLSVGDIMNNNESLSLSVNGSLPSGSAANVRWEVTSADTGSGIFNLIVRRGDDYNNSKTILETWNGLSLDPNQNNYIGYVIGDQTQTILQDSTGDYYLQTSGSYKNNSRYIRVKTVNYPTPGYFDQTGQPRAEYTASIPVPGSGSVEGAFGGAAGVIYGSYGKAALNMFENIPTNNSVVSTPATNIQGVHPADYSIGINLLENSDAYDFNVIYAPGINSQNASSTVSDILTLAQGRGDAIAVIDMTSYGQPINTVITNAQSYDNSYGATYWPWVQIRSRETGKINFVPASTLVPAVYEYNDKVSAEWFAPAGLNRGALSTVLQPERKIGVNDRNTLYQGKVNPIATFPGVGTVIYGQKTLQQKPSALDRVNVRRLLIALKDYIGQLGEQIVFEPNTQVTRNKFLNQVNPYLESVQQRQGLYAFQVVMDETNNTPDVVDRNQLVGTIYLQPTKTAEFIQLDFNILPTGTTFGQ
jgi:phage tail sheath protein FI